MSSTGISYSNSQPYTDGKDARIWVHTSFYNAYMQTCLKPQTNSSLLGTPKGVARLDLKSCQVLNYILMPYVPDIQQRHKST